MTDVLSDTYEMIERMKRERARWLQVCADGDERARDAFLHCERDSPYFGPVFMYQPYPCNYD